MKFKHHKYLQVGAIVILCLAAYASMRQVEGFQATDMPIYNTLDELVNSIITTGYRGEEPIWRTREIANKEREIKFSMDNSYPEHTTLMNEAFAKSKAGGDKYDVTIDKLYSAVMNNYVPKSPMPEGLAMNMGIISAYVLSIKSGKQTGMFDFSNPHNIPTWYVNLRPKFELLHDAMETKFGYKINEEPPADKLDFINTIQVELRKIIVNIFNESKSLPERDDETIAKVINAQIEFVENYRMPVAPSATSATPATPSKPTTSTSSTNLAIYIGVGVGVVVLLGIIAYFMFSGSQTSVAMSSTATIS